MSDISEFTTNRLSVYLRCLDQLEASGVRAVSSKSLAEDFGLNAAQIRKDLAHFGELGVRGGVNKTDVLPSPSTVILKYKNK